MFDQHGTQILGAEQAERLAARFVGSLRRRGIDSGERVVFQADNSARLIAAVLGCLRSGYIPVVISSRLTPRERDELTLDVTPRLFVDDVLLEDAFDAPAASLDEHWHCRPMHFTSGTSGRPKGVWSGWLDPAASAALIAEETEAWGLASSDSHLVVAPLSHSAPLRFPLMTLMAGGSVRVPAGFAPEALAHLLGSGVVDTTFMAPAHLQRLTAAGIPRDSGMRLVAHAGSSCPESVRDAARSAFGDCALREFYGSTEGQFTICTPAEFDAHPGTVGRARPGRRLRTDAEGHIWCRVPPHARFEYWQDPIKTADAWNEDWFTVGDLGALDDDGYLYLSGRRSDLIISGGVNVYPAEIERVILERSDVSQAIAFGIEDPTWGQRVCLAVVGSASAEELELYCTTQLAPYKRPKEIHVVPDLPHTHSGKVDRLRIPEFLGLKA